MKTPLFRVTASAIAVFTLATGCGDDADTSVGAPTVPVVSTDTTPTSTTQPTSTTLAPVDLEAHSLTGTITLQGDDIALPEGTVVVVSIDDVSLQDAASVNVTERTYEGITGFPFDFELLFDADLADRNTYAVSARVTLNDQLIFVNDTHFDVTAADTNVDIFVISVGEAAITAATVIGLSEQAAIEQIGAAGLSTRTMSRDGDSFAGTTDYREDRVNLTVVDDIVTETNVG